MTQREEQLKDLELQCKIVQRFVDRSLAVGETGRRAFAIAKMTLSRICIIRWHLLQFEEQTNLVLPNSDALRACGEQSNSANRVSAGLKSTYRV